MASVSFREERGVFTISLNLKEARKLIGFDLVEGQEREILNSWLQTQVNIERTATSTDNSSEQMELLAEILSNQKRDIANQQVLLGLMRFCASALGREHFQSRLKTYRDRGMLDEGEHKSVQQDMTRQEEAFLDEIVLMTRDLFQSLEGIDPEEIEKMDFIGYMRKFKRGS